jgi:hypothetical protein
MIPGSCQDLHKINKLEPATRDNLDWFGFGYSKKCDPRVVLSQIYEHVAQGSPNKIKPIQTNLNWAKECYMNLNIK